jgi:hypothetical protein
MGSDTYEGGPVLSDATPYARVAYQKDYGDQNFEVGTFGLFPQLNPGGVAGTASDNYSDVGLDASYQYIGDSSGIFSINALYTHEAQNYAGSQPLGFTTNRHDILSDLRFDASYYWHNIVGATIQPFDTWGSSDAILYAGDRALSPNSQGVLFQIDGTPFGAEPSSLGPRFNIRVGLQYTAYARFDGASHDYDGLGHNASDNNTFRIFAWFAF